jgi:hypothetical protein
MYRDGMGLHNRTGYTDHENYRTNENCRIGYQSKGNNMTARVSEIGQHYSVIRRESIFIIGSAVFIFSLFYTGWVYNTVTVPLCTPVETSLCEPQIFNTVGFTLVEIIVYLGFGIFLQYGTETGKIIKK